MSGIQKDSSGANENPSGTIETPEDKQEAQGNIPDDAASKTVSREAYQKALNEKRAAQRRLDELESKQKAADLKQLEETNNYKKLYEDQKAESEKVTLEKEEIQKDLLNGLKLQSFLDNVGGEVSSKYWSLIKLEDINVDPETKKPDEVSLKKAVDKFKKNHPEIILTADGRKMPNDAPRGKAPSLSYEDWCKLSWTEQKKRFGELDQSKT